MSSDVDTIASQLQRQYGIAPDVARRKAEQVAGVRTAANAPTVAEVVAMPAIQWPLKLTLPWSYLCSDNARFASGTERNGGGLLLTSTYRRCRGLIRDHVRDVLGLPTPEPASIPLEIEAAVYVPDNRPHDCTNFAKVCHDALEKLVYTNDRWLYSAHWYRAAVDVDRPRAEITIRPRVAA